MEKLQFSINGSNPNWYHPSSIFSMVDDINTNSIISDLNSDFFFNPSNWDTAIDHTDPFESALSSIVSSPTATTPIGPGGGDGIVFSELIGRLGTICNNNNNSNNENIIIGGNSTNTSCYTTPLNSPPNFNYSRFGIDHVGAATGMMQLGNVELGDSREGSSVSEHNNNRGGRGGGGGGKSQSDQVAGSSRKRKSNGRGKGKDAALLPPVKLEKVDESNAKRSKAEVAVKVEDQSTKSNEGLKGSAKGSSKSDEKSKKDNAKTTEPPKDYIHVRARRGQATDSHSLAERVRREKISERMKFLQDLVPGCSKVTGKAVVLDEIINYVQSLQQQVEFLSMKLAGAHPRMDFNMEALLSKDIFQSGGALTQPMYPLDVSTQAMQYAFQAQQMQHLQNCMSNGLGTQSMQFSSADLVNGQIPALWEKNLQNIVPTGVSQNQAQTFHGQMKVEL